MRRRVPCQFSTSLERLPLADVHVVMDALSDDVFHVDARRDGPGTWSVDVSVSGSPTTARTRIGLVLDVCEPYADTSA